MKLFVLVINDEFRLDITGSSQEAVMYRAAKVLGGSQLHMLKQSGVIKVKRIKLEVMV